MKRILSLVLATALMAACFTGCGCMDRNVSTHPGGMITEESSFPTVMPQPTATHSTEPRETTRPQATLPTVTGSDPTDENSTHTGESSTPTDSTMNTRNRNRSTAR